MILTKHGNHRAGRLLGVIVLFLLFAVVLLFLVRETLLDRLGTFMAPGGDYVADVAILEGTQFLDRGLVECGMELLSAGKVDRLVVVLHRINPVHRPFAIDQDYPESVRRELKALGLEESDFDVIVTPIQNPITLTAAKGAMEVLSRDHVENVILISQGFRTRRTFLAYQRAADPFQVTIHPSACFTLYQSDRWWSQGPAVRNFTLELQKLLYYLARGYVPVRSSR